METNNPLYDHDHDDDVAMIQLGKRRSQIKKLRVLKLLLQVLTFLVVCVVLLLVITDIVIPRTTNTCMNNNEDSLLNGLSQVVQLMSNMTNISYHVDQLLVDYQTTSRVLYDVANTVSDLKSTVSSTDGTVDDILLAINNILDYQNRSSILNSIRTISCANISSIYPESPTGMYHVNGHDIYCNMDQLCGSGGGWTRVGYFDMTDVTTSCPTGYRLYTSGTVRACGRPANNSGSCTIPLKFPTNGISYTQICGRVTGYQYGSPDSINSGNSEINSYYLDGVSITRGSPRQHVWSLMGGLMDSNYHRVNCPCNSPPGTETIEPFIGSNYFCESGNHGNGWSHALYANDPLWDGQGCGTQEGPCCAAPGLPWFHRQWNISSTKYIELRVCGDQNTNDEDTPISYYEIYVK